VTSNVPSGTPESATLTQLLGRWSAGDRAAVGIALPRVYAELRRIAARELRRERPDHTLGATEIVHEAYLRLIRDAGDAGLSWPSRNHFFAFASHLMRRILVDHARHRNRQRRGGGRELLTLSAAAQVDLAGLSGRPGMANSDLLALDEALSRLAALDPQKATIVELRFFGGLTVEETAGQLGVSVETVGRHWRRARAWLYEELHPAEEHP
jgi:RNA polymerase sigma factor (TIGR02999 family)